MSSDSAISAQPRAAPAPSPPASLSAAHRLRVLAGAGGPRPPPVPGVAQGDHVVSTPKARVVADGAGDGADADEGVDGEEAAHVNQYRMGRELGRGAFAVVREAEAAKGSEHAPSASDTDDEGGRRRAIKIFSKSALLKKKEFRREGRRVVRTSALDKVRREVAIMKKVRHANVVRCHEIIDDEEHDNLFMVLEFVRGGQAMDWDPKARAYTTGSGGGGGGGGGGGVHSEAAARRVLRDAVHGLEYLHAHRIVHRDIKPENLLLVADPAEAEAEAEGGAGVEACAKLADLGVAHFFEEGEEGDTLSKTEGTPHFMAPECASGGSFSACAADVWALGVTLYAMVTGKLPFDGKSADDLQRSVAEGPLVLEGEGLPPLSEGLRDLIRGMLNRDASARLSVADVKRHAWLGDPEAAAAAASAPAAISVTEEELSKALTPAMHLMAVANLKLSLGRKLTKNRKKRARKKAARDRLKSASSRFSLLRASSAAFMGGGAAGKGKGGAASGSAGGRGGGGGGGGDGDGDGPGATTAGR